VGEAVVEKQQHLMVVPAVAAVADSDLAQAQ
jgi:hypothetical protein